MVLKIVYNDSLIFCYSTASIVLWLSILLIYSDSLGHIIFTFWNFCSLKPNKITAYMEFRTSMRKTFLFRLGMASTINKKNLNLLYQVTKNRNVVAGSIYKPLNFIPELGWVF